MTKKPWEMTQYDFLVAASQGRAVLQNSQGRRVFVKNPSDVANVRKFKAWHKDAVKLALDKNKTVPDDVLKDYPELITPAKTKDYKS